MARTNKFGGQRKPAIKDAINDVRDTDLLRDRGDGPCLQDVDFSTPTALSIRTDRPQMTNIRSDRKRKRCCFRHIKRTRDAGDIDGAYFLIVVKVGTLQCFIYSYRWSAVSCTTAGQLRGNAMPPLVMRTLAG